MNCRLPLIIRAALSQQTSVQFAQYTRQQYYYYNDSDFPLQNADFELHLHLYSLCRNSINIYKYGSYFPLQNTDLSGP